MSDWRQLHALLMITLAVGGLGVTGLMIHVDRQRRRLCGGVALLAVLLGSSAWSVFHGNWTGQLYGLGICLLAVVVAGRS